MTFDLDPFERLGPLSRGLSAAQVIAAFGRPVERFRKTSFALLETLDIGPGLMHVSFDADGCAGVEVFPGSGLEVVLGDENLLVPEGSAFVGKLVALGQHWEVDDYGIHAPMLGIATFSPGFDWNAGAREIDVLYVSLDPDFVP